MWQHRAPKENQQRSGVRFTLPVLPNINNRSLLNRPQLQMNKMLKLDEELVCTLGDDISQIPSATHSTMRHLSSRHHEVSQWQAQISESIGRVDQEITAVEQVKDIAEHCLQEKQLYSQLIGDCVAIINSQDTQVLPQDRVWIELRKEEQLTNEIRELLQKQICILLHKLSSLNEIRAQLLADFQDKGEVIKLTTKCINHDHNTLTSWLPATRCKPNHVSYDKWLSHCKDLKVTAESLIKVSSSFRGNLRLTLANLKNAHERQRRSTDDALRKKINNMNRVQDTMIWERQRVKDEISDLTKDIQKVAGQIRNCDSKLHQAIHLLDILNQRPRLEQCVDKLYISLTLEKHDLAKMVAGLHPVLKCTQQDIQLIRRHLVIVEDKLAKNGHALEVQQKCLNLHRSFLPALNTNVVLGDKPWLRTAARRCSPVAYLQ